MEEDGKEDDKIIIRNYEKGTDIGRIMEQLQNATTLTELCVMSRINKTKRERERERVADSRFFLKKKIH